MFSELPNAEIGDDISSNIGRRATKQRSYSAVLVVIEYIITFLWLNKYHTLSDQFYDLLFRSLARSSQFDVLIINLSVKFLKF